MIDVDLTLSEVIAAATVGLMRHVQSVKHQHRRTHGIASKRWSENIEGAIGECVVAKYLGVYWTCSLGNYRGPDVGPLQVRTARHRGDCLIVRADDRDADPFVFVTGDDQQYQIRGWIWASDAKRPDWLTDKGTGRPPAYFVPTSQLSAFNRTVYDDLSSGRLRRFSKRTSAAAVASA